MKGKTGHVCMVVIPRVNYYQVLIDSQFGVNLIYCCQSSLLIENNIFYLHGIEVSYIPVHSHDIQVIARDLGFALVLGDNLHIMLVSGYNYNIIIYIYSAS